MAAPPIIQQNPTSLLLNSNSNPQKYTVLLSQEPHLRALAKKVGDEFLKGDATLPWLSHRVTADFQGTHDLFPGPMSIVDYIELARKQNAVHPKIRHLEVLSDWVEWDVDDDFDGSADGEGQVRAAVWQFARVVTNREGTVRASLRVSRWRRRPGEDDGWLCHYYALWRCDPTAAETMAQACA